MLDTVIMDIGNVLVDFCWEECLRRLHFSEEVEKQLTECTTGSLKKWQLQDRGNYDYEELVDLFLEGDHSLEWELRQFLDHWNELAVEYDYAYDWVKRFKDQGYLVYLLSNYGRYAYDMTSPNFSFLPLIDGAVISYQVNLVKPEQKIYKYLLRKYDIKPENAVFFDDRQENVEAAVRLGIHGIEFHNPKQAYEEFIKLREDFPEENTILKPEKSVSIK